MSAIIPIPRFPISIRPGTIEDIPFLDSLQKKHTKQVGWMPTKQFEGKVKAGHVLVAETVRLGMPPHPDPLPGGEGAERVGYLIGNDQYFKRDDVGIIYQINIAEGKRRGLVAAQLLKAQFDRSAYGCKLYCCWCAQDIEANYFWEALGFVPLAFRAGSREKGRVHIFWQRRIREGDEGQGGTPYWFPAQTTSGAIREDRLVLPIPPGTHWRDVMPIVLPALSNVEGPGAELNEPQVSPARLLGKPRKGSNETPVLQKPTRMRKQFAPPSAKTPFDPAPEPPQSQPAVKKEKPKRQKQKNDPKLVAAARELRDRWLEKVNSEGLMLESRGKYEVSKTLSSALSGQLEEPTTPPHRLLPAA